MSVKGLMVSPSENIGRTTTVMDACRTMSQQKAVSAGVVDNGRLCGIFTYRDLVDRVLLEMRDPETTTVGEVMTDNVHSVKLDSSYGEALRLMVERDYTHVPVVREDGSLAGMLSLRTLLEHEIDHLANELDAVSQYLAVDGPGGD